jgi:glycosyltransferase involved in cell wall biosynthesis
MNITVVLCTYNRCELLATALESVAASELPASLAWEVLVVDNNSQDRTREVVEEFSRRFPGRFRYLFESRPGKSFALNSGIRESYGEILAFMDDDVTVERGWLHNLTAAIDGKEWVGAGGRIVLQWPASLPDWLSTNGPYARHPFPGFDQGPQAGNLVGPPFGTNMAFERNVFAKYGGFRTDLGPEPGSEIRAEDTEFGRRVIAGGERLRYEPAAVVYHPVPAGKIRKAFFLKWRFDYGRGDARESPPPVVHLLCSFAAWTLRWIVAFDPRVRFFRKVVVWEKAGSLAESARQRIHARSKQTMHRTVHPPLRALANPAQLRNPQDESLRTR